MHHLPSPMLLAALAAMSLGVAFGSLAGTAAAVEPVDSFLEVLRERQLFDESIDYLNLLATHPHVEEFVKQKLLYEQGLTMLASASVLSTPESRIAQLSKASGLFSQFLKAFPQHDLAAAAKSQLANILIEHGRIEVQSSQQAGGNKASLVAARKRFAEARDQFDAAEKELEARLQKMPKFVADSEKPVQTEKRQLGGDMAQLRLLRASIDYELAKSFEPAGAEAKKHLKAAAEGYAGLYETYRTRSAGLLARLWEGICYQEMGDVKRALGCYQELMDLPSTVETRSIKTKSTRRALECWTRDGEKKYPEAIERGERWEKESGPAATDADALAIRYLTALAYQASSSELPAKDPNRKKLAGFARQYVVTVAKHPGEYQRPAKMLLVALGGNKDAKDGEKTTFVDALARAKQSLERMQEAEASMKAVQGGDQSALKPLQLQKEESATQAREALQLALTLADSKTNLEDLNSARYYLCYLAWDSLQYYDAAVLGEFLAARYPDTLPGRQGARIALNAYVRLANDAKAEDKRFAMDRLEHVAEVIFKQWPGQEEADDAALTLLNFAASQNQLDKSLDYLKKIAATSPRRGQAELRAGQLLWSAYLRGSQSSAEERPPQEKLDDLKKRAQEVLAQGIERMEKAPEVDATLAAAVFAMAQICVETNQPDKAVGWLENAKMGSLTLVKAGSPAAAREPFAAESYKLALRAYIGVQPQQLNKAEEVMDALEKLVKKGGDAKAAENLTAIYISLGRELQQQLQDLRKSGKKKELQAVSKAFEVFLDRVTKRDAGNSFASLNWVGETYYSLGNGSDEGAALLSPQAKAYFQKATTAYQRMLEVAENDPKLKDQPESLIGIRLRLADCYCKGGKFDDAIKLIVEVLREKPMLLTAQVQAAETYQARGMVDPAGYAMAITGGAPAKDGKNVVWGWAKLSKMTMSDPKFQDSFHQSRLNMAEARYLYALTQKDAAKRSKILDAAKQDLWFTYKLHPTLGGEKTAAKYDRLLKLVQKSLGSKEIGIEEFKQRDAANENTAVK